MTGFENTRTRRSLEMNFWFDNYAALSQAVAERRHKINAVPLHTSGTMETGEV